MSARDVDSVSWEANTGGRHIEGRRIDPSCPAVNISSRDTDLCQHVGPDIRQVVSAHDRPYVSALNAGTK